jgi:hypothetical protein
VRVAILIRLSFLHFRIFPAFEGVLPGGTIIAKKILQVIRSSKQRSALQSKVNQQLKII